MQNLQYNIEILEFLKILLDFPKVHVKLFRSVSFHYYSHRLAIGRWFPSKRSTRKGSQQYSRFRKSPSNYVSWFLPIKLDSFSSTKDSKCYLWSKWLSIHWFEPGNGKYIVFIAQFLVTFDSFNRLYVRLMEDSLRHKCARAAMLPMKPWKLQMTNPPWKVMPVNVNLFDIGLLFTVLQVCNITKYSPRASKKMKTNRSLENLGKDIALLTAIPLLPQKMRWDWVFYDPIYRQTKLS